MKEILHLLWSLLVIVAVLLLAYGFTRLLAGRAGGGLTRYRGRRVTVLEKIVVGKDQKLLLVKLGEEYYFLGVAQGSITNLGQVPEEVAAQWEAEDAQGKDTPSGMPFQEALRKVLEQRNGREGD